MSRGVHCDVERQITYQVHPPSVWAKHKRAIPITQPLPGLARAWSSMSLVYHVPA